MSSSGELEIVKCKSCGAPANPYAPKCEYCGSYFAGHEDYYESDYEDDYTRSYSTLNTTMSLLPIGWAISMSVPFENGRRR